MRECMHANVLEKPKIMRKNMFALLKHTHARTLYIYFLFQMDKHGDLCTWCFLFCFVIFFTMKSVGCVVHASFFCLHMSCAIISTL